MHVCLLVCSYENLRMAFSDLRGQLIHLTGQDPLKQDHPLGALPVKVSPLLLADVWPLSFLLPSLYCVVAGLLC